MNTSHENIFYIDPWFIAREYESRRHKPIPSKITRSSQSRGNLSLGLSSGSVGTQESMMFEHSPESTFWEISSELAEFDSAEIESGMTLPDLFWVSGTLALYGRNHKVNDEHTDKVWTYSITQDYSTFIRLITEDSFFRFNLHKLIEHPHSLGMAFRPKVRALLRGFRCTGEDRDLIATPLVIFQEN